MAPLYKPATKVQTVEMPYLSMVTTADPQFERRKHREVEYEVASGKVYVADPYVRGIYNSHSNVYPVGQPYGQNDPLVVDNRPLYSGVPTDGWA